MSKFPYELSANLSKLEGMFPYNEQISFPIYFPFVPFSEYIFSIHSFTLHIHIEIVCIIEGDYIYVLSNIYSIYLVFTLPQCNATVTWELYKVASGSNFSKTIRTEKKVKIVNLRHYIPFPLHLMDFSAF